MMMCLSVPLLLGRRVGAPTGAAADTSQLARALYSSGRPMGLADAGVLVVISVGSVWLAGRLGILLPKVPEVLWLTTLVLLLAQMPAVKKISGGAMWGYYLLLLFLSTNGAQSVIANILAVGPSVVYFAIGTVVVHGVVIFGLGLFLRFDLATLLVASQANVGGPPSAMALATARGYMDRVLPGVAAGLLGYAVGNYTGFAVGMLIRGLI